MLVRACACVCVCLEDSGHLTSEDLALSAHRLWSWFHFSSPLPCPQDVRMGVASIQSWEPTGTTVTVGECLRLGAGLALWTLWPTILVPVLSLSLIC